MSKSDPTQTSCDTFISEVIMRTILLCKHGSIKCLLWIDKMLFVDQEMSCLWSGKLIIWHNVNQYLATPASNLWYGLVSPPPNSMIQQSQVSSPPLPTSPAMELTQVSSMSWYLCIPPSTNISAVQSFLSNQTSFLLQMGIADGSTEACQNVFGFASLLHCL